ncbi:putative ribonuclease H protein [Glycine soja]
MGARAKRGRGRPHLVPQSPVTHLPPLESSVKETLVRSDAGITEDLHVNAEDSEEERDVEVEDAETLESIDNRPISPKAEIKPMDPPKLWVDAVSDNRNPSKGLYMEYVAPNVVNGEVEIEIEEDDIATEMKFWETTLILYALGEDLSMNAVKSYMVKMWNFVKLPEMYYHDDGYFILRFNSHDDMDVVLMKGPYTIRNVPLLLKEWKPDFNLQRDMLRTLPLWVKLPKLPLHLWGVKSLNKIGSAIGVPLVTDECIASKIRVSYAHILVEVDITKTLVKEVTNKDCEGRKITQGVEYEWRPLYCEKCHKLGHQCKKSGIQKEKQWKPKTKPFDETVVANATAPSDIHTRHEVINETGVTNAAVTPKEGQLKINEEDKGDTWTRVSKPTRDRGKLREISSCLSNLKPDIMILLETRVKETKASSTREKLNFHNIYIDNYQSNANGRIWVSWDDMKLTVQKISNTDQFIHCGIYDNMGKRVLWKDLEHLHSTIQGPWCVIGDFNNVASANDRIGGRIDRVLGNVKWFQDHLDYHLKILPPSISDHALLCVEGYEEVVQNSWNRPIRGTPMHVLWQKLQRLKPELVQLGKSMTNTKHELVKARRDLGLAQNATTHNRMDGNLIDTVKRCTDKVINWNEMEDSMLRQRAKKGDGTILTKQSDIHNEVMEFYGKLMGCTASNLRQIDIQAMRDGKQITFDQGVFLTATVTEAEIVKALQGIGDLKAPDDVLLLCRGDEKSIEMILKAFSFFSKSTRLQINPTKCKVFCGGLNCDIIQVIKKITRFEEGTLPVRYLGVPLSCKKLNVHHYLPLVEKIVGRIRHWSSKLLSIAGRIQLVRSIITAIAQYWMSVFPIPKKVIQKIDSICRSFIWSGSVEVKRKSLVAWKQRPKVNNLQLVWIEMLRKRKFSMKQVYMELVEDHNRADWFRLLRYNRARPRANVTLWLSCQNRLATKTRLKNMNMIQCSLCSLCKEQDEDLDHLMFSCRVTKAIWLEVLKWMDIDHTPQMWRDEVRWVMQYTKGKGWKRGILKLAFSEVVYEPKPNTEPQAEARLSDRIIGPPFGGGPIDLSLIQSYRDHCVDHVWIQHPRPKMKLVSHGGQILPLPIEPMMRAYVLQLRHEEEAIVATTVGARSWAFVHLSTVVYFEPKTGALDDLVANIWKPTQGTRQTHPIREKLDELEMNVVP